MRQKQFESNRPSKRIEIFDIFISRNGLTNKFHMDDLDEISIRKEDPFGSIRTSRFCSNATFLQLINNIAKPKGRIQPTWT